MSGTDITNEIMRLPLPETLYAAGAVAIGVTGYIVGRIRGTRRNTLAESREKTRQLELELEGKRVDATLKSEELRYANAEAEHQRNEATAERERRYEVEDEERSRTYKLEDAERQAVAEREKRDREARQKAVEGELEREARQARLARVEAIRGVVGPMLEAYLASVEQRQGQMGERDEAYLKEREEFRRKLVDDVIEHADNGDGFVYEMINEEVEHFDDDTMERIRAAVDAKFPLVSEQTAIPVPKEIKELVELLRE